MKTFAWCYAPGTDFLVIPDPLSGKTGIMAWNPVGLPSEILNRRRNYYFYNDYFCRLDDTALTEIAQQQLCLPDEKSAYPELSFNGNSPKWDAWLACHAAQVPAHQPEILQLLLAARFCGFPQQSLREALSPEAMDAFLSYLPGWGTDSILPSSFWSVMEETITRLPGFVNGFQWILRFREPQYPPPRFPVLGEIQGGWSIYRQIQENMFFLRQELSGNVWEFPCISRWQAQIFLDAFLERLDVGMADLPDEYWLPEEIESTFALLFGRPEQE